MMALIAGNEITLRARNPRNLTDAWEWVRRAHTRDVHRSYLRGVWITTDGDLWASDRARLHLAHEIYGPVAKPILAPVDLAEDLSKSDLRTAPPARVFPISVDSAQGWIWTRHGDLYLADPGQSGTPFETAKRIIDEARAGYICHTTPAAIRRVLKTAHRDPDFTPASRILFFPDHLEPAVETISGIRFRRSYLTDAVAGLDRNAEVKIRTSGELDPILVEAPGRTVLIMPCR